MLEGQPLVDWAWIAGHLDLIGRRAAEHLLLALLAVAIGLAISMALSIWSVRDRRVFGPIALVSGLLYTIPSLALFAALIPITGLSVLTAEIALVSYTLLILVRNIVAGFDAVPRDVIEAADAMGYPARRRLVAVELPLALPFVVAGVRLASVSTIGLVSVAGLLGDAFGGLGVFITEGLQQFFATKVYVGAVLSIALAFCADAVFLAMQRRLTPWTSRQPRTSR